MVMLIQVLNEYRYKIITNLPNNNTNLIFINLNNFKKKLFVF